MKPGKTEFIHHGGTETQRSQENPGFSSDSPCSLCALCASVVNIFFTGLNSPGPLGGGAYPYFFAAASMAGAALALSTGISTFISIRMIVPHPRNQPGPTPSGGQAATASPPGVRGILGGCPPAGGGRRHQGEVRASPPRSSPSPCLQGEGWGEGLARRRALICWADSLRWWSGRPARPPRASRRRRQPNTGRGAAWLAR